jgi:hypothetical protein
MFHYPALCRITPAGYPYNHLSEKAGDTLKNKANDPALPLCSTTAFIALIPWLTGLWVGNCENS